MHTRVTDEPAVVLHTRPYRENSLIVTAFTLNHGRVSFVARGVRSARRGRAIQPFTVVRVGWSGRTALGTMTGCEALTVHWYRGNVLACAFYLAELVVRLVAEREAHPRLYAGLVWALEQISERPTVVLRSFEKLLLEEMGYAVDFERDVEGVPIREASCYRLVVDLGFEETEEGVPGHLLRAIARDDFSSEGTRRAARSIFGEALARHLGPRPLMSRKLLITTRS
ncbi:MAG: DNA repair protein RecO [Gammaproteobacteria bacterium]